MPPGSYDTGGPVTLPPAPRGKGFEFIGWLLAPEGGEPLVDGFVPVTPGPITIYAQWRPVVPMFVDSLTAILFGFAVLVSAVTSVPGWMRAQAVMAAQLADDWAAADRVSSAAQVAALRDRLRQLEGVAGERAATWRARLLGELDRLAAEGQA